MRSLDSWPRAGRPAPAVAVLGALIVSALMAGCGTSLLGEDPDTALLVEVSRGPIEPVAREGQENSAPVAGALVRIRADDRGGQLDRRTGPDGRVRVPLDPGRYEVEVLDCPGAVSLPAPASVIVAEGREEALALVCDTGIR